MDKKVYNKPVMVAETFTPNNFVSTCDWWMVKTNNQISTYYHDNDKDGNYESGEEINIIPIYFQYSENNEYLSINNDNDIATLNTQTNDGYFYDGYNTANNKYQNKNNYNGNVYKILGTQSKGSTSQITYWYTTNNLSVSKSAS